MSVLSDKYRRILIAFICLGAFALGLLYLNAGPESGLYPRCLFKSLTGLSCPGCGSQRAAHALLGGDIRSAFGFNALLMTAVPLAAMLYVCSLTGPLAPRLRRLLSSRTFILSILSTIIIWTIVRNIFGL